MQPVGSGSYAWACWLVGVGMVVTGVHVREFVITAEHLDADRPPLCQDAAPNSFIVFVLMRQGVVNR